MRIVLAGFYSRQDFDTPLHRIRFKDPETGKRLVFLTNNFALPVVALIGAVVSAIAQGKRTQLIADVARSESASVLGDMRWQEFAGAPASPSSAPSVSRTAPPQADTDFQKCPRCGRAMIRRVAKKGSDAGKPFWGCSGFPDCRGTRSAG